MEFVNDSGIAASVIVQAEQTNTAEIIQPEFLDRKVLIDQIIRKLLRHDDNLSFTSLYNFKRSPVHFIDYKLGKTDEEQTAAMKYGSMLHCLVLEPAKFEERYFCFDDSDKVASMRDKGAKSPRATKEYKEWAAIAAGSAGDRTVVTPQEWAHARLVAFNVRTNRAARKIMDRCPMHEVKIEWEHQNFKFRGYIDGKGERVRMDLKSMPDAEKRKAQRTITDRGQYIQAAMYQHGDNGLGDEHFILAVDKMSGVSVHQLDQRLLEQGYKDYEALIMFFNHCIIKEQFEQSFDFWAERWDGIYRCEMPGYLQTITTA